MAIVESLMYPQMNDREWQIHAADDSTLGDLFIGEESKRHPQTTSLLSFLEGDSGLFLDTGQTCFWQINTHEISAEPEPRSRQAVEVRRP